MAHLHPVRVTLSVAFDFDPDDYDVDLEERNITNQAEFVKFVTTYLLPDTVDDGLPVSVDGYDVSIATLIDPN